MDGHLAPGANRTPPTGRLTVNMAFDQGDWLHGRSVVPRVSLRRKTMVRLAEEVARSNQDRGHFRSPVVARGHRERKDSWPYHRAMSKGVRLVGRSNAALAGVCSICGTDGPFTWAHVPPQGASNQAEAANMVADWHGGFDNVRLGRLREGGTRVRTLCQPCNGKAGEYDQEWIDWWKILAVRWDQLAMQPRGPLVLFTFKGVKPGAFVRSVLAGTHALNATLRTRWPGLASAILNGDLIDPPSDLVLLFSLYTGAKRYVLGGPGIARGVTAPNGAELILQPEAEIPWPPMHLVLVAENGRAVWPGSMNVLSWLRDAPDVSRDVDIHTVMLSEGDLFMQEFAIPGEGVGGRPAAP